MNKKKLIAIFFALIVIFAFYISVSNRKERHDAPPHNGRNVIAEMNQISTEQAPAPEKAIAHIDEADKKTDSSHASAAAFFAQLSVTPLFSLGTLELEASVVNALQINGIDRRKVESEIKLLAEEFASKAIENAELVKSESGETYFKIPKLRETKHLRDEFKNKVAEIIGDEKSELVAALAHRTPYFPDFGAHDIEVYIQDDTNSQGKTLTYIATSIVNNPGDRSKQTAFYTLFSENFEHPLYRKLTDKFATQLR